MINGRLIICTVCYVRVHVYKTCSARVIGLVSLKKEKRKRKQLEKKIDFCNKTCSILVFLLLLLL